ncbi:hypothetical protein CJ010_20045 [Azoarcus sp. DD4]|uniref:glycosyltransferase family 2 protein n=1 Tax=Azoarcus sp. DD4 TaxID=2027405 RepID=UPI001128DC7D|nr:glycosyltransferase [Azoarcus sp. DD4]QDF98665.1 hypothetical protein CJ010_20045 [Azoarcus sp. DD4]
MQFSVIIPTYNRRQQLGQAIASALSQEDVSVEVIVVDDGSTDGTLDWLAAGFTDPRIRVLRNTRSKGPAGARNTGLQVASGDFIALLDSDDCFLSGHLSECARAFAAHPGVDVLFGRAEYEQNGKPVDYMGPNFDRKLGLAPTRHVDAQMTVFAPDYFNHLLQYGCYFNLSTVVLRAGVVQQQLMNETLRIAEDYEYWVRLSRSHGFACLHRPQIRYTLHDENISFEADGSAAEHAPSQIAAYEIMLAYPALDARQVRLIKVKIAEVLFNWAYRCRKHRRLQEAMRLHLHSLRFGLRRANLAALLKLGLVGAFPALEARGR